MNLGICAGKKIWVTEAQSFSEFVAPEGNPCGGKKTDSSS